MVKNPSATQEIQEIQFQALGWEDPLEKEMATHSNILAWKIPWTENSGGVQAVGSQRIGQDREHTTTGLEVAKEMACLRNNKESVLAKS